MTNNLAASGSAVVATLTTGLAAGFFYTYEASVTRALAEVDDRTYVQSFQAINETIQNPAFGLVFFGSIPILLVAAGLQWSAAATTRRAMLALAPALYLVGVIITATGNVPLNDELAMVDSATPTVAAARADFEDDWNRLNLTRGLAFFGAFGATVGALAMTSGLSADPIANMGQTD